MRLFISINFDEETKRYILAAARRLRELGDGNFSRPENLHLTLAFLGEIAPARALDIRKAMDSVTLHPMELIFDHAGCFKSDGGELWWIGLAENKNLLELHKELSDSLLANGFRLENRRFSPHITLARKVQLRTQPDRATLIGQPFSAQVSSISLMCSGRIGGRLTYTEQYARKLYSGADI